MISKITTKGQVTLPKEIRSFLNVKPSDRINFVIEEGTVILKPVKTLKDFKGSVQAKKKTNIREERKQAKTKVGKKVIEEMK